jgi:hypothetical protein
VCFAILICALTGELPSNAAHAQGTCPPPPFPPPLPVFKGLAGTCIATTANCPIGPLQSLRACSENWYNNVAHLAPIQGPLSFAYLDYSGLANNLWATNGVKALAQLHDLGQLRGSTLKSSVRGGEFLCDRRLRLIVQH